MGIRKNEFRLFAVIFCYISGSDMFKGVVEICTRVFLEISFAFRW